MTNSATAAGPGKRERLVLGAKALIHEQGVNRTTIADIAERADVPLGNVYYYFKTKDELVAAVVESYAAQVRAVLESLDRHRTPQARLKALARMWVDQRAMIAQYGCPLGSLCSELDKSEPSELVAQGAELLTLVLAWAGEQFASLGRRDAKDLALHLLSGVQGAALFSNTLRDPEILSREVRQLERWIDSIA
jgi:AcrR family transcriptional regulator